MPRPAFFVASFATVPAAMLLLALVAAPPARAGIYVGIAGGYDCSNIDNCADSDLQDAAHVSVRGGFDFSTNDLIPGANFLKPGLMAGVEGYFNYSRPNLGRFVPGATATAGDTTVTVDDFMLRANPDYQYGVTGRVGLKHRLGQVYGLGGYGWEPWVFRDSNVRISVQTGSGPVDRTEFNLAEQFEKLQLEGWHVGGGVLVTPTRNIGAFLEMRYSEMEGTLTSKGTLAGFSQTVKYDNQQVSVGLRFGL